MGRPFVLARHAQSALNLERRVIGEPALDVPLTERGVDEACGAVCSLGIRLYFALARPVRDDKRAS